MFLGIALRRGYRLLREGRQDAALAHFTRLSQRSPRAAAPCYEIGKIHYKQGNSAGAREALLAALERSPGRETITGILELTNWWMIGPPNFFNTTPCFSPDGKQLLFCSARQDTNGDGKIDITDRAGIYRVDLASSVVTEVVSNRHPNFSPSWSPDGRSMLYFSSRLFSEDSAAAGDENRQLLMRDLATGEDRLVVPASLHPRYPVFTPDGRRVIVCTVDTIGGPSGLSIVDLETGVRRSLTSHAWEHTYPQISSNGKWLTYVSWRAAGAVAGRPSLDTNPAIYLMNLETEKEHILVGDAFSNAYPRFSPQGDSIVFLARRHDTNGDGRIDRLDNFGIYTLRLSDRKEKCVSSDTHFNKFPAWSPDGKQILFLGHRPGGPAKAAWESEDYFEFKGLYRVPAAGGDAEAVVSDKFYGSRFCEVSPQGSVVAYVSWRPKTNRALYIADYMQPPTVDQLRSFVLNNLS
jgi:Tol biopolymer transport system component